MNPDVIVVGLGALGSATAHRLALRGARVVAFDRFAPPHARGSSHGRSRIIREAYFEDPVYVPLVQRADAMWRALEAESGAVLLRRTGGLMIGPADGVLVRGALASARQHGLAHDVLTARETRTRFPSLLVPDEFRVVWEPRAGVLSPEACVRAQIAAARRAGADVRVDEEIVSWSAPAGEVVATSARGEYRAAHMVLAAGAWLPQLAHDPGVTFVVERQVQWWFAPRAGADRRALEQLPVHLWEQEPGRFFYGFPLSDGVMKVARHHEGESTTADAVRREVDDAERGAMSALVARYLPDLDPAPREHAACLYTNAPDGHFVIDRHPAHDNVIVASACSGHGFKFAPVLGEDIASFVIDGARPPALAPFALDRFAR